MTKDTIKKRKRCPNGTRKNKNTDKCEPKYDKKIKSPSPIKSVIKTKKMCPSDKPIYNPRTNRCVINNKDNRKKIEKIQIEDNIRETEKAQKVCPPHKPLYNPITNRCLMDTLANKKKLRLEINEKFENVKQRKDFKALSPKINLDLKKADLLQNFNKVTDNIWEGNMYKILMGMYYVLQRHNNACFLSGKIDTPRRRVTFDKFNIIYETTTQNDFIKNNSYGLYKDLEVINKKEYDVIKKQTGDNIKIKMVETMFVSKNFNLKKQIDECKKNNKRFVVGLIFLAVKTSDKLGGHENSYIYDIKKQELEIFEPNGSSGDSIRERYNTNNFYSEFLKYFKKNKVPIKKFYKPIDYCPIGPQYNDQYSVYLIKNAPGGYCASWSIYYLDSRLSNPNIPRELLITTMNTNFRDQSAVFINSYSTFIVTHFLTNVLDFNKLKKKYPTFLKNFNNNKLTKAQQKYLNEQLLKEMNNLVYSM